MKFAKCVSYLMCLLLVMALCLFLLPIEPVYAQGSTWDGEFPLFNETASFSGGNGLSAANAYRIGTAGDLAQLSVNVNAGKDYAGMYFRLMAEIDLDNHPWIPIGGKHEGELYFRGSFDGDGHIVRNLTIMPMDYTSIGLFGCVDGENARISNLSLVDCDITSDGSDIGCLVGEVYSAQIINCRATGTVLADANWVGGLLGNIAYDAIVTDCYAEVTVSGLEYVGGLIGYAASDSIVTGSYATGDVYGSRFVGGLIGDASSVTVANCYATGAITGEVCVGGLVGRSPSSSYTNCFATGDVSANGMSVGGLLGFVFYDSSVINCFATGDVSGDTGVGGLAGELSGNASPFTESFAKNCYATGNVTGSDAVGGLFGFINFRSIAENCYSTGEVLALATGGYSDAGGFAGTLKYGGAAKNCVTLSPSVAGGVFTYRVGSGMSLDATENCFAWKGMLINNGNGGVTIDESNAEYGPGGMHGVSITNADALSVAFWQGEEYAGPGFGGAWLLEDGALPKLFALDTVTGEPTESLLPGQTGEIPEHLRWKSPFADVTESDWFYNYVGYMAENVLMVGTSDSSFSPHQNLSRAMLVTILWRAEGSPDVDLMYADFADVAQGSWYEKAVAWAAKNAIATGYGEGLFGPNDPIKREELVTMLYRYAGLPAFTGGQFEFNDVESVSDWALDAFVWATEKKLVTGKTGGLLDPQGTASRAEAAAVLARFIAG